MVHSLSLARLRIQGGRPVARNAVKYSQLPPSGALPKIIAKNHIEQPAQCIQKKNRPARPVRPHISGNMFFFGWGNQQVLNCVVTYQ